MVRPQRVWLSPDLTDRATRLAWLKYTAKNWHAQAAYDLLRDSETDGDNLWRPSARVAEKVDEAERIVRAWIAEGRPHPPPYSGIRI